MTKKCTANAELNLLISNPCSGPALSLKENLEVNNNNTDFLLLDRIIIKEENWLNNQDKKNIFSMQLEALGWNIGFEEWTEVVYIKVDSSIIKRWLDPGSEYREIILKEFKEEELSCLKKLFESLTGQTIKQKLFHTKLVAKKKN